MPLSLGAHAAGFASLLLVPMVARPELPAPRSTAVVNPWPALPVRLGAAGSISRSVGARRQPPNVSAPRAQPAIVAAADPTPNVDDRLLPDDPGTADASTASPCLDCPPTGSMAGLDPGPGGGGSTVTTPVRVGGQIRQPVKLHHVDPVYPEIAVRSRVQAVVVLECTLDPQGRVADVRVLRGHPLLDAAAVEAVRQWRYTPTLLNEVPVPVIMSVTVAFTLR
jgi:protein TonB